MKTILLADRGRASALSSYLSLEPKEKILPNGRPDFRIFLAPARIFFPHQQIEMRILQLDFLECNR